MPLPRLPIATLLLLAAPLAAADRTATVAPKRPAVLKGVAEPGREEAWTVVVEAGRKARVRLLRGRHDVVFDVFDPDGLAANEGVDEADPFPVRPGRYRVTVSNVTGLAGKAKARRAAYEIRFEVD